MRSSSHRISALLVAAVLLGTLTAVAAMSAEDCHTADMPVLCHGARVVRSVVDMRSMRIMDGVEIVRIADEGANNDSSGREAPADTGNAYVDRVLQYLRTHEIKISLNDWLQRSGMAEAFAGAMREAESANEVVDARRKDKGSMSTILITALMMKKFLAALGMGAIAALSAKALGVAMIALLLSALMGLKKLSDPHEGHGHRKRRDIDATMQRPDVDEATAALPYRGWAPFAPTSRATNVMVGDDR